MERPALVRTETGAWRLYTCCASPGSKHWWIDVLEADDPAGFAVAEARMVFPGDDDTAVKDPIVQRVDGGWQAWICCHPLDQPGEEDRMTTAFATSADGLEWTWHGTVLAPRPGKWDARGTRLSAVLPDGRAAYDARATKDENWFERTGLARRKRSGPQLEQEDDAPVSVARYLDVLPLPDGGYRIYYEWPLPDNSHELRTELMAQVADPQRAKSLKAAAAVVISHQAQGGSGGPRRGTDAEWMIDVVVSPYGVNRSTNSSSSSSPVPPIP
jgi:hypothetical protein